MTDAVRHTQLLTAALCRPDVALQAWQRWRQDRTIFDADREEARLLPAVAANIGAHVDDDPDIAKLLGNRRHAWAANTILASQSFDIAHALLSVSIESVFFKGLGLLPYYGDISNRLMHDADLLVHWHDRHDAIDRLAELEFEPLFGLTMEAVHALTDDYPGFGFRRSDGVEIDLHWRPLHGLRPEPHLDQVIFDCSREFELANRPLRIPDPGHHAVLVASHGHRYASGARLIGIVDVSRLLASDDFDPARAAELARQYRRVSALRSMIDGLDEIIQGRSGPALDAVQPRLDELRRRLGRPGVEDRLLTRRLNASGPSADRIRRLHEWWRAISVPVAAGGPVGGAAEMKRREWGLDHSRDLLPHSLWLLSGRSPAAWRFRRTPAAADPLPVLRVGERLDVTHAPTTAVVCERGWWGQEQAGIWSRGDESSLAFVLDIDEGEAANLAFQATPFVTPSNPRLVVDVRIGPRRRALWRYEFGAPFEWVHRISVGVDDLVDGVCRVVFVFDGATSPLAAEASSDPRVLGIALSGVAVEHVSSTPIATGPLVRVSSP